MEAEDERETDDERHGVEVEATAGADSRVVVRRDAAVDSSF